MVRKDIVPIWRHEKFCDGRPVMYYDLDKEVHLIGLGITIEPDIIMLAKLPKEMTKNQFNAFVKSEEGKIWALKKFKKAYKEIGQTLDEKAIVKDVVPTN